MPGGPGTPEKGFPALFAIDKSSGSTSRSAGFTNGEVGMVYVVTAVDMTCTGAEPVQCFANITGILGEIIYWDSQSTGEGLGVSFNWRGFYIVEIGNPFHAAMTSASSIAMGIAINGFKVPQGNT